MAWHYKKYANEQLPSDRVRYEESEKKAKESNLGLWKDDAPIPPWEWRKIHAQK
ncbi:MAG: hypothetical protein E6R03_11065 [Hyphomicrobiaceae bacterium]|jgi:endonuclease YncB( thermonuclease family)|nr:MAG: hypothetical protein E6R03_11065 [Hyphomicrobiaceae bacterium]